MMHPVGFLGSFASVEVFGGFSGSFSRSVAGYRGMEEHCTIVFGCLCFFRLDRICFALFSDCCSLDLQLWSLLSRVDYRVFFFGCSVDEVVCTTAHVQANTKEFITGWLHIDYALDAHWPRTDFALTAFCWTISNFDWSPWTVYPDERSQYFELIQWKFELFSQEIMLCWFVLLLLIKRWNTWVVCRIPSRSAEVGSVVSLFQLAAPT